MRKGTASTRIALRKASLVFGIGVAVQGCATVAPRPVTPEEIPELEQAAIRDPENGRVHLRLAVALLEAGRCEEAIAAADRGRALVPDDPVAPLVIGQCLERDGRFSDALALYTSFTESHRGTPGIGVVEGRRMIALRGHARATAREALEREGDPAPSGGDRVGVLPFVVDGDSIYRPLQVGLAHMLTTDLALLQRFPMVERVQLDALLEELQLPPELVDRSTAARTGRLLRADRMILGTVSIPTGQQAQIGSNIVLETGEVAEPFLTRGDLDDILELEKELAIRTAEGLGYPLTEAEIQRIRQNAPASMLAFLAFSNGLMAENRGDYRAAATHYAEAVRADPGYREAQQRMEAAVGADVLTEPGGTDLTTAAAQVEQDLGSLAGTESEEPSAAAADLLSSTLDGSIVDVASHQAERSTKRVGARNTIEVVVEQPNPTPSYIAILLITIMIPRP